MSSIEYNLRNIPISGIDAAAGGVLSARRISSTKNATNIFIPEINHHYTHECYFCIVYLLFYFSFVIRETSLDGNMFCGMTNYFVTF